MVAMRSGGFGGGGSSWTTTLLVVMTAYATAAHAAPNVDHHHQQLQQQQQQHEQQQPSAPVRRMSCASAQARCLYREGCAKALTNYMLWCSDVVRGDPGCSEPCQHALVALTSTDEGQALMNCDCQDDDCVNQKRRVEVCRPHVLHHARNETMSCRLSQMICAADAECSTALRYYQRYCRAMFNGKKCTHRCHNSIAILRKQAKAERLSTCRCDGFEEYDCPRVKGNMERLCFHRTKHVDEVPVTTTGATSRSDVETNEIARGGAAGGVELATLAILMVAVPLRRFAICN